MEPAATPTTRTAHHPNYLGVFLGLLALTILEVAIAYQPIGWLTKVGSLLALAVTKALLVALYYMHLKFDRRLLALVALTPFLLISAVCLLLFAGPALLR